ncbi:MAG TPA: TonB-dependent receptor [Gammaproteobacteria bacterium]|nr:TonB-dependent receptor [Gammaproteobacteria bacterium]
MKPVEHCSRLENRLSFVALGVFAALAPAAGSAQTRGPMQEIVITATRSERSALDSPFTLHVLDADTLSRELQARSVPEALRQIPGIMVQKTAHGQGSPFIRGFTGFRTLFLIDGIRLNNSTFRDGPNQYWNTVDPLMIQRLEVVKGPSSVLYGSDAVGGTVNALLMRPQSPPQGDGVTAQVSYRAADAEDSSVARAQVGLRSGDVSLIAGYSLKDFGDLTSGAGHLPKTGYDEDDADLRLEYDVSDSQHFVFAHQRLTQDDAWRTHATIYAVPFRGSAVGSDLSRLLEQGRDLTYAQYYSDDRDGVVNAWNVSLSAHRQDEFQHRHRGDLRVERQGYTVDTAGLSLQGETEANNGRWVYGIEHYHDSVDSFREDFNANGTPRAPFVQGPVADDATYDLAGVYAERQIPIGANWEVISGVRYAYAAVDAERVLDTRTNTPMSIDEDWDDSVASVRFRYASSDTWNLFGGVSQGFRAPNLSDLTRLDTARSSEIETPVATLDPEQYVSYEFGFKTSAARSSLQMAVYYTSIDDMIVRTPTGTTIGTSFEVTKRNSGRGFTRGFEIEGGYDLTEQLSLRGAFTWSDGELDSFPTSSPTLVREPMSRIMPPTTVLALRWSAPSDRYWFEASALHAEEQTKLAASDRLDTQRIPPGGTPQYSIMNLRSTMTFGNNVHLSAAIENVTNQNYRVHGSGLNETGRNVVLTMDWQTR